MRFYDQEGKRRTRTFEKLADAKAFNRTVGAQVERGEYVPRERGRVLFADYAVEVDAIKGKRRQITRERDAMVLRTRLLPVFGGRQIGRISKNDVQRWVCDLEDEGLAPSTIHKAYRNLARVLERAVDDGLIPSSPCRRD